MNRGAGIADGTGDLIAEIADFATDGGESPHVVIANHRGDTVMTINANDKTVSAHLHYDAFGNIKHKIGSFSPTYTFSTKEYLEEVALYLYPYRAYDPISGRWTQRDPIDYQDSINLYQFCGNNPVNGFDIDGLKVYKRDFIGPLGPDDSYEPMKNNNEIDPISLKQHRKNKRNSTKDKHTKPRPGRKSTKNRQKPGWRKKT